MLRWLPRIAKRRLKLVPCSDLPPLLHFFVDGQTGSERLCLPPTGAHDQRLCTPKSFTRRDEFPALWQIVRPLGLESPSCAVPRTHIISTLLVAESESQLMVANLLLPSRRQSPSPSLRPPPRSRPIPLGAPLPFQGPPWQGCPPSPRRKVDYALVPGPR